MNKKIFILLYGLILSHGLYGMKPDFKTQKLERRTAYNKPYTTEDKQKLARPFSILIAGTVLTSAGLVLQESTMIGLGLGLIIGGADDVSNYYKYQRRYYNQNTTQ